MTEYKRDLKEDLAIFDIGGRSTEDIVYGVVAPHALERAIAAEEEVERLNHLLTEKDAIIKELQYRLEDVLSDLKIVQFDLKQIAKHSEAKEFVAEFAALSLKKINSVLGEGDKDGN